MAGQIGVSVRLHGVTQVDLNVRLDDGPWSSASVQHSIVPHPQADPVAVLSSMPGQKQIELRGTATVEGVEQPFERTYSVVDTSDWTSPLNDTSLSLADRLSGFAAGLAGIDAAHELGGYLPGLFVVEDTPQKPRDVDAPEGLGSLASVTVNRSKSQNFWSELPQFWPFPGRTSWDVLAFNVNLVGHAEDFTPYLRDYLKEKYARSFCAAHDPSQSAHLYLCFDPEDACPWYWLSARDIGYPEYLRMPDGTQMGAEQAVIDFVQHRVLRLMRDELYHAAKKTSPAPVILDLGYTATAMYVSFRSKADGIDVSLLASP